jgi:hypothetical protein
MLDAAIFLFLFHFLFGQTSQGFAALLCATPWPQLLVPSSLRFSLKGP